jgi:hypothetical protein
MKKLAVLLMVTMAASGAFAQVSDTLNVTATINAGVSTLDVSGTAALVNTPAANDQYAISAELTATFFAANGPWSIIAESDGLISASKQMPVMGADGKIVRDGSGNPVMGPATMGIKLWQANFGPAADAGTGGTTGVPATYDGVAFPDPDVNSLYWRNPSAPDTVNWLGINKSTDTFKTKLASTYGQDESPIPFRIGVQTLGMPAANDYSGTITFTMTFE